MDDIYVYILAGVVIGVFIIIMNHQRQKDRVTDYLKDAKGTEPILAQQAIERKLKTLKVALYGDAAGTDEDKKQFYRDKLDQLEKSYAAGEIAIKAYDEELRKVIGRLSE